MTRYFARAGCDEPLGDSDGVSQTSAARASVSVATSVEHRTTLGVPARPSSDQLMPTPRVRGDCDVVRCGRRRLALTEAHLRVRPSALAPEHASGSGWRGCWCLVRGVDDRSTVGVVSWLREPTVVGLRLASGCREATGF